MLIFTLSSIPPRFGNIGPTLDSMLAQTAKADRIILYIPETYRHFPDWDGHLPEVPEGVEIHRVPEDLGPATKILPAIRAFQGTDTNILFGDDDRAYPPEWAEQFLTAQAEHPGCVIAKRGLMADRVVKGSAERDLQPRAETREPQHDWEFKLKFLWMRIKAGRNWRDVRPPERRLFRRSGYIDIFEGCGGVLVRPEFFDEQVFDIPPEEWSVDDIWLSACLGRRGVPIWLVAHLFSPPNTDAQAQAPLAEAMIDGLKRSKANQAAVRYAKDHFGIWI